MIDLSSLETLSAVEAATLLNGELKLLVEYIPHHRTFNLPLKSLAFTNQAFAATWIRKHYRLSSHDHNSIYPSAVTILE